MGKKQNKNSESKKTPDVAGKKVKAVADVPAGQKKPKIKLNSKAWLIIITAAVLVAAIISITVFFIVDAYRDDKNFDYLTADLTKYVTLSADDYKNYSLEIDIAKPHTKNEDGSGVSDVDVALLNLIASERELVGDGAKKSDLVVGAGDNVYIWYRGYLKHPETGEEVEVSGMCNFGNTSSAELGIGTGSFVPGFELNLVGTDPTQFARFKKITSGKVAENQVIYITYTRTADGSSDKQTGDCVRVDLNDGNADERFGEGFTAAIMETDIGQNLTFNTTIDGVTYKYTDTEIEFATTCENESTNGGKAIKVVECYFPYDYGTDGLASAELRNETAYFEVYIEYVQDYSVPEWNDEFVTEKVSEVGSAITMEELEKYEGRYLVDKYRAYAEEYLNEAYQDAYDALVEEAMWNHYLEKAEVKRYPGTKVDEIYKEYVDDVYYQFEQSGGSATDSLTGESTTYDNVDEYAVAYLGLTYSENQDWKSVLQDMSKDLVKERLILYYIMQVEDLTPTADELNAKVTQLKKEYLDEYVKQYLEYEEKTKEDYPGDEYDEFVSAREKELYDYYNDDYFTETAYYEIVLEVLLLYPDVSDLDERTAYPYATVK